MRLPRIRLRLSLRTLLLIILVAALWLGWRVDKARRQRLAIAQVEKYNGHVRFDYEYADGKEIPDAQPRVPKWLRRNLGDEYFREVSRVIYVDQPLSDATLAPLTDLSVIEELRFLTRIHHHKAPVDAPPGLERVTESGLSRLEGLTRLRGEVFVHALRPADYRARAATVRPHRCEGKRFTANHGKSAKKGDEPAHGRLGERTGTATLAGSSWAKRQN